MAVFKGEMVNVVRLKDEQYAMYVLNKNNPFLLQDTTFCVS